MQQTVPALQRNRLFNSSVYIQAFLFAIIFFGNTFKSAAQPTLHTLCPGANISFSTPGAPSKSYKWQIMKTDANAFSDLANDAIFSGVNTNALNVSGITTSFYGSVFRCLVTDGTVVSYCDTNYIKFSNTWTGQADNNWNNPNNWMCPIIPDNNTDVYINAGNAVVNANGFCRSLLVKSPATLQINSGINLNIAINSGKEAQINSNVRVIDSTRFKLNMDSTLINKGIYEFSFLADAPYILVNDVIVGDQDKGYARKVLSVEKHAGKIILRTEQAGLVDIFKTADLNFTINTDKDVNPSNKSKPFATLGESANYNFEFTSFLLNNSTNGSVTVKSGKVDVDGDFNVDFKIANGKLHYFALLCNNFQINTETIINANLKANRSLPPFSASVDLFTKGYWVWMPIPGPPFRIPLYFELSFGLVASAQAKSINAEINTDIALKSNNSINLGLVYENNDWKTIKETNFTSSITSQNNYLKTGLELETAIGAEISFKLFKVLGPYCSSAVTSNLAGNLLLSPGKTLWDINTELSLTNKLGINASIAVGEAQAELFDYSTSWKLLEQTYKTPHQLVDQTGELSAAPGSFIASPISVQVLDNLGNPESNVQVFFRVTSGGGSLESASAFTNSEGIASTRWKIGSTLTEPQTMEAEARIANNTAVSGAPIKFTAQFPQAYSVSVTGGDEQLGQPNQTLPLPLGVQVKDKLGNPMAGVKVDWSVSSGSGILTQAITYTDNNGMSSNTWQLGATGQQVVKANVKKDDGIELKGSPAVFIADLPGMMTIVAGGNGEGNALNQLKFPQRIFVDSSGCMYINDMANGRIVAWQKGGSIGENLTSSEWGQVAGGDGIFVYHDTIYYSPGGFPTNLYKIRIRDTSSLPRPTPVFGNGSTISTFTMDNSGNLYLVYRNQNELRKFPSTSPSPSAGILVAGGNGIGASANQLYQPSDVWIDSAGNLLIADAGNFRVQNFASGQNSGITVGACNQIGIYTNDCNIVAVCVDKDKNVYVADDRNRRVQKWIPGATSGVTIAGGNGQGSELNQFAMITDLFIQGKYLYMVDKYNHRVMRLRL